MRILHSVETLSRQAGGLAVAVRDLAAELAVAAGKPSIELLSSGSPDSLTVAEAVSISRVAGGPLAGFRASRRIAEIHETSRISVVHQHGLWAPLTVAAGRFAGRKNIPLVISPHGMLEPWALGHHAARKAIAMQLYQRRNLESASVLHATSENEASQFRDLGLSSPVAVIPLGVSPIPNSPLDPIATDAEKSRRQLLMLSRIHPKKGIDLLLDAWDGLDAPDWELVIAGNDEGGHQAALEAKASDLGLGDRVRFAGPLFGADKDTAFRRADLFVLPSHSENFGFVVPEALQYGLPVITTTGTPWKNLPRENCAWWVDPVVESIAAALREAIALSESERKAMGQRGVTLVERDHHWPRLIKRYLEIYDWLAGGGEEQPDWLRID